MRTPLCVPTALRAHAAWFVLAASATMVVATFSGHTFGWAFILPPLRAELGLALPTVSLLWALAVLSTAPLLLIVGQAIDRFGQFAVALFISPVWALAVYSASAIESWQTLGWAMFVMRLLGPGVLCMCAQASIGHWFDRLRGRASMLLTLITWLMLFLQGRVEVLVRDLGWRAALRWLSLLYVVLLVPSLLLLRDEPEAYGVRPDGDDCCCCSSVPLRWQWPPPGSTSPSVRHARRCAASRLRPSAVADEGLTRAQALRCPAFWAVVLAHASIEFGWAGSQLFIVEMLGERGLSPEQVGDAQAVGSAVAMACTIASGVAIDRLHPPHEKRWVLVAATAASAAADAALLACRSTMTACLATGLMGAAMGSLDVVFSVLYASMFGRAHLGGILGMVNTLVYVAIGASPPVFALARRVGAAGGAFDYVLWGLVIWMPLPALGVALAPLPRAGPPLGGHHDLEPIAAQAAGERGGDGGAELGDVGGAGVR